MESTDIPSAATGEIPTPDKALSAIAYSLDALLPGLYIWWGKVRLRIGGSQSEASYTGTIHDTRGVAIVLPGYRIYSTYQGTYDP